jgi:peptidyl-prolyl cis-trans isomerase SurA
MFIKTKMRKKIGFVLFSWFLTLSFSAKTQEIVADKIIAKVDDYIILKSDLELAYQSFLRSGDKLPGDARCGILREMIINKVLMAKAEIDSVSVEESAIERELDQRLRYMVEAYGGDRDKIAQYLGKSLEQITEELREPIREQMTVQKMRNEITKDLKVTPSEVRKFFKNIPKDSIPLFPAEYEVGVLIKNPIANKAEKERVREQLLEFKRQVEAGEADFASLAALYSEDLGSASKGGDLGFHDRGELVPEYEAASFAMEVGAISEPIESQFGYHLIQLLERRGNLYRTRHILMRPKPSEEDIKATELLMDSLRQVILENPADFQKIAVKHTDDKGSRANSAMMVNPNTGSTKLLAEEMDFTAFQVIDRMKVGELSPPLRFRTSDGKDAVRILYFKNKIEPHVANLEQDYEKIQQAALSDKRNRVLNDWFLDVVKEIYIDIAPEYNYCGILQGL